ncbi:MAG TPA: acyl-CoA dehydrogenase family protein [Candidatus Binatia bacterium]|nr:acyl-CoA dehydrogenase family protein [Candidatus Binatia bacterium]
MDFGLSDDQQLFAQSLRGFLSERVPMDRVRTIMESRSGHDSGLLLQLAEQGVTGILVPEARGGSGLGLLDAAIAAHELGRAATPFSFHSAAVMAPVLLAQARNEQLAAPWLERIAAGKALVSVIHRAPAISGGALSGTIGAAPDAASADALLVVSGSGAGAQVVLVPRDAAGVEIAPLCTVDDTRRIDEVRFDGVRVEDSMRLDLADAARAAARAIDAGRVVLAADALGAADRSLELAVQYALTREQFGRVIGSFQAVKHMCAEVFAEIEPVRSLLWYAAFAWDDGRADASTMAALVKSHGSEAATEATTTCVQVYGGMGFTYECDMHIWFKRAGYDRQMLGGPAALREQAAAAMLGV